MLPKKRRVASEIFTSINECKQSKNFFSPYMSLQLTRIESITETKNTENKKKPESMFAVVVSKKTERLAIERNKTRRQVYSLLRNNLKKIKNGFIGVFFIKKEFKKLEFLQKEKEILKLLEKAGMIL